MIIPFSSFAGIDSTVEIQAVAQDLVLPKQHTENVNLKFGKIELHASMK